MTLFGVLGAGVFTVMLLCAAIIVGFGIAFGMEVFSNIKRYFLLKKVCRNESDWIAWDVLEEGFTPDEGAYDGRGSTQPLEEGE